MSLRNISLAALPSNIGVPRYDRQTVTDGIVHIGVGGFHRAHEAVYLDDLLNLGESKKWAICGVGIRPSDSAMRDALMGQDCLYTVVTRDSEGDRARVIGSLTNYLFGPDEPEIVLEKLAAPETRIVSLTITEGGYGEQSGNPESAFGYLATALKRRSQRGLAPFTVLSCDNLQHNGDAARASLLSYTERDAALHNWIAANVAFPNCMVDRITPQTTDADRALVRETFNLEDAWPVMCEPSRQWIVEDNFVNGRPSLEEVGVQFTSDVHPYEMMKLGLLNGSHFAMAYLGFLAGFTTVPDIMADPLFRDYIRRLMDEEVTPLLPPVPGIDLTEYKQTLMIRFANPAIKDQVTRLCLDGSSKFPKFLLPSLTAALATGRPHRLLGLAFAGWLRYLSGTDEQGKPFVMEDPQADALKELAREGGADPGPLLGRTDLFGDLGQSQAFRNQVGDFLTQLYADGAQATLKRALT